MSVLILVSCLQWIVFSTLVQNKPKFWSFDFDSNFGFGRSIIYTYDLRGSGKKNMQRNLNICTSAHNRDLQMDLEKDLFLKKIQKRLESTHNKTKFSY